MKKSNYVKILVFFEMKRLLVLLFIFSANLLAENRFINNYVFEWIDKNPQIVENYLIKSAKVEPVCFFILGTLYLEGTGFLKNLNKADFFITKAAQYNLPEALTSLGDGYFCGDIRDKNLKMALNFYEKAAKLGYGSAQFNAGVLCLKYLQKSKENLKKAVFYFNLASKNKKLDEVSKTALKYKKVAENEIKKIR